MCRHLIALANSSIFFAPADEEGSEAGSPPPAAPAESDPHPAGAENPETGGSRDSAGMPPQPDDSYHVPTDSVDSADHPPTHADPTPNPDDASLEPSTAAPIAGGASAPVQEGDTVDRPAIDGGFHVADITRNALHTALSRGSTVLHREFDQLTGDEKNLIVKIKADLVAFSGWFSEKYAEIETEFKQRP